MTGPFQSIAAAVLLLQAQATPPPSATTFPSATPATTRAALPAAQQVIDRYIEVTGGRDAYAGIRSRRASGTFAIADLGIAGTMSTLVRANGDAVASIEIPNVGLIRQGVTGDVVWEVHPISGPKILEGAAAAATRRTLMLFPRDTIDGYHDASIADVAELNGRPAYRMVLTADAGDAREVRFYDVESGLLVKILGKANGEAGEVSVTTTFSDYEDVPPIRMPMKTQQTMAGMSPESVMTKVEHNVALPDAAFALPPEIVELQKHRPVTRPATPTTRPATMLAPAR